MTPLTQPPVSACGVTLSVEVAVVGGGPAGLMAAQTLSAGGVAVHLFDAMPTVGRKFLLAGIGGLNLTHAEPLDAFVTRYGERQAECGAWLQRMGPQAVRDWAQSLGIATFVGSSQRVFPTDMKAAPLLRAWLHRLRHPQPGSPVTFHMRHRWQGDCTPRDGGWRLTLHHPAGVQTVQARAVVLALGGGSWAKLGSDGAWQTGLPQGVEVRPLQPANCGFDVAVQGRRGWSEHLVSRSAGQPLKNVAMAFTDDQGRAFERRGEFVLTASGVEGSLIYAASALLRDHITRQGQATLSLDLRPDWTLPRLQAELSRPRAGKTLTHCLKNRLGLEATPVGLLYELLDRPVLNDPARLAQAIKALPLTLVAPRPLDEAISSAGGVALESLSPDLMLREQAGLFAAGEMLDWEAPTGGYLLTACLASGRVAGEGVLAYLQASQPLSR